MSDEIRVVEENEQRPINEIRCIVPAYIMINGRKCKTRLASKSKIFKHQTHQWFLLTWKQLYTATKGKITKTPQFPYAVDPRRPNTGSKYAEINGMFAMAKDYDLLKEEERKRREETQRKQSTGLLTKKEQINKIYQDGLGLEKGKDVVRGETFKDAERWAGTPEGKIEDTERSK